MESGITKRSVSLNGRKTSVSLEDEFWGGLKAIADQRGMRVSQLIAEISSERERENLSSTLRVFVLDYYKTGRAP